MSSERGLYDKKEIMSTESKKLFHCPACSFFDKKKLKCSWSPRRNRTAKISSSAIRPKQSTTDTWYFE